MASISRCIFAFGVVASLAVVSTARAQTGGLAPNPIPSTGVTRTYYIAADEVDWDYMPGGRDGMMGGMGTSGYPKFYASRGPHLIGHVYRKAVYREYTDGTFAHLKPRTGDAATLGALGPIIRAEVGDTIVVVFRNHGTHPYSMHPHGVLYAKASEGAQTTDDTTAADRAGGAVQPGHTFTYTWSVPERAGPGPDDPSSIVWLYHSHTNDRRDVNAGLIGPIVITRAGMANADGSPKDVDHEFVALFMIYDENTSDLIGQNVKRFVGDKSKKFSPLEAKPLDPDGNVDPLAGTGFLAANFRSTINGYQYADGPAFTMKRGDRVRWYIVSLGEGLNFHTAHWHGNTLLWQGHRTDVIAVGPASMQTADMIPDNPGSWMLHCHLAEHMATGMMARYTVDP